MILINETHTKWMSYTTAIILFLRLYSCREKLGSTVSIILEYFRLRHVIASVLSYVLVLVGLVRNQIWQSNDYNSSKKRYDALQRFSNYLSESGIYDTLSGGFRCSRVFSNLLILYQVHRNLYPNFALAEKSDATHDHEQQAALEEAARMFKFACIIYGHDAVSSLEAHADKETSLSYSIKRHRRHSQLVCEQTGICDREDILTRNCAYGGSMDYTNHTVVLDRERKQIIFAVRGTYSLSDALVDLEANSVPFCGGHAHAGMARIAKLTFDMACKSFLDLPEDYELVITGHSLGAGVATLMTIMILHEGLVPNRKVRCFAFGPPATFYPLSAIEPILPQISAFVYGDDVIPVFSVYSSMIMNASLAAIELNRKEMSALDVAKVASGLSAPPVEMTTAVRTCEAEKKPFPGAPPLTVAAHFVYWFHPDNCTLQKVDPSDLTNRPMVLKKTSLTHHMLDKYSSALRRYSTAKEPPTRGIAGLLMKSLSARLQHAAGDNPSNARST